MRNYTKEENERTQSEKIVRVGWYQSDIHKITEIMMNLISNAIKYTPKGGSVYTQLCEIPCEKEGCMNGHLSKPIEIAKLVEVLGSFSI